MSIRFKCDKCEMASRFSINSPVSKRKDISEYYVFSNKSTRFRGFLRSKLQRNENIY